MGRTLARVLGAAAVGWCTISQPAASAGTTIEQNATPLIQLAQGQYYGDYYEAYRPACPERYFYACWSDPYGYAHCGCRPGLGYYLFRFY